MLDSRSFTGWRRLTASVLDQAGRDDPAALAQVLGVLDQAQDQLRDVVARLREPQGGQRGYSWAEIGAALGISRQAAQKRFSK